MVEFLLFASFCSEVIVGYLIFLLPLFSTYQATNKAYLSPTEHRIVLD